MFIIISLGVFNNFIIALYITTIQYIRSKALEHSCLFLISISGKHEDAGEYCCISNPFISARNVLRAVCVKGKVEGGSFP